jgi:hypothetical protein
MKNLFFIAIMFLGNICIAQNEEGVMKSVLKDKILDFVASGPTEVNAFSDWGTRVSRVYYKGAVTLTLKLNKPNDIKVGKATFEKLLEQMKSYETEGYLVSERIDNANQNGMLGFMPEGKRGIGAALIKETYWIDLEILNSENIEEIKKLYQALDFSSL